MLCKNYEQLGHFDKVLYIGELLHACQSDDDFFNQGKSIIQSAKKMGIFEGVIILPDVEKLKEEQDAENN
jgi:hypothetical protein